MDFTVSHLTKLAELLKEPEPEVLQGEDLKSTSKFFSMYAKVRNTNQLF